MDNVAKYLLTVKKCWAEGIVGTSSGNFILKKKREILNIGEADVVLAEKELVKRLDEAFTIAIDLGLNTGENDFASEQFAEMCVDLGLLDNDLEIIYKKIKGEKNSKGNETSNHNEIAEMAMAAENDRKGKNPTTSLKIAVTGTNFVFHLDSSKSRDSSDESLIKPQFQEEKSFEDYDLLKKRIVNRCKELVMSKNGSIEPNLEEEVLKESKECQDFLYQLSLTNGNLKIQRDSISENIISFFREFESEVKAEQKMISEEFSSRKENYKDNLRLLNERDKIRIQAGDKTAGRDVMARLASSVGLKDDPEWNKIVHWHEKAKCKLLEKIPIIFESFFERHLESAWDEVASVIHLETYDSRRTRLTNEKNEKEKIEKKQAEDLNNAKNQVKNLAELRKIDKKQFETSLVDFIVAYPQYEEAWLMLLEEVAINDQNARELLEISKHLGVEKVFSPIIENRKAILEVKARINEYTPSQLVSQIKAGALSILPKRDILELFEKYPQWVRLAEQESTKIVLSILCNLLELFVQIQEGNVSKASQIITELEKYASSHDSIHFINCARMAIENENREKLDELFLRDYLITSERGDSKTMDLLDKFNSQRTQIEKIKKELALFRNSLDEDVYTLIKLLVDKKSEMNQISLSILPFLKVRKFLLENKFNFTLGCIYKGIEKYSQENNPIDLITFLSNLCLSFHENDFIRAKEFSTELSRIENNRLAFLMHQLADVLLDFSNTSILEKGLLTIWSAEMGIEIPMIEGIISAFKLTDDKLNKLRKISCEINETFGGHEGDLIKQLHNREKIEIDLLQDLYNYFVNLKRLEYVKAHEYFVKLKDRPLTDDLIEFIKISGIQVCLGIEGKLTENISYAIAGIIAEGNFSFLILKEKCYLADFHKHFNEVMEDMAKELTECQSRVVKHFEREAVDLQKYVPESPEEYRNKIVGCFNELFFQGMLCGKNEKPLLFYYSGKESVSAFITQDGFFAMHPNNVFWFYPHLIIKNIAFDIGLANAYYTITKFHGKPVERCKCFGFFGTFDSNSSKVFKNICNFEGKILTSIHDCFGESKYSELFSSLANSFPAAFIEFSAFARNFEKARNPYDYDTSACQKIAGSAWLYTDSNEICSKYFFDDNGSILIEKDSKKSDSGYGWKQDGRKVVLSLKDELTKIGTLFGDRIQGMFIDRSGKKTSWSAFRLS